MEGGTLLAIPQRCPRTELQSPLPFTLPVQVNFLFDTSQTPHVPASQIASYFGLSSSTMQAKSKQIRDVLDMYQMDPNWTLPSKVDDNPLVWMIQVNGLVIDARHAPREIQEEAFRKGLITHIPER